MTKRKRNRSDLGLWYLNDPTRVNETAEHVAGELSAMLKSIGPSSIYQRLLEKSPHYETLSNGETKLALWRALALVQIEICNDFTRLGYESKYDFYDDEDEDDDEAVA